MWVLGGLAIIQGIIIEPGGYGQEKGQKVYCSRRISTRRFSRRFAVLVLGTKGLVGP